MTIKERLWTNMTGMKVIALYLWLGFVVVPFTIAYVGSIPRATEELMTLIVRITAMLVGLLMGTRLATDLGVLRKG